ncbi:MAG TPA: LON peptidase substrate-binding domain-containing protein, partial [Xanthomonadales bacterium]|nr:LON peptidase substrate-binding domain-containing protein [Xanthomonadales bacterium]
MTEIPLFPLRTVLFPDGFLPLRIFEQRYLKMVRDCTSNDTGFGVCLILEGEEAISPVRPAQVGTLAAIVDWYTLDDGLLGVSAMGGDRFQVHHTERHADGLMLGQVELLAEPGHQPVPEAYSVLTQVLARFLEKVGDQYPSHSNENLDDAGWVGYRLAELLPLSAIEKQQMLELNDPIRRLQDLLQILP